MLREDLGRIVTSAIDRLIASGGLPEAVRGPVEILDTKQPEHGDYACNFALAASKKAGMNPRELAEKLRAVILEVDEEGVGERGPQARRMVAEGGPAHEDRRKPLIHEIEIAGPGFLNLRLKPEAVAAYVAKVLELGPNLPKQSTATPRRINVEYVSVNPNGPITVGSGRGAAFGDTLSRVLTAAGNTVNREYYINDGVNSEQMRQFGESVRYYVVLRIYGEYSFSGEVREWNDDLLALINKFALERWPVIKPTIGSNLSTVYDAWHEFALQCQSSDDPALASAASAALANDKEPYYREQRPGQIYRYCSRTWSSGAFTPPVQGFPAKGYKGDYVRSSAKVFVTKEAEAENRKDAEDFFETAEQQIWTGQAGDLWFQQESQNAMLALQRRDLAAFGVHFDTWFSEQSLHDSGEVQLSIDELIAKGAADEDPIRTVLKLARGGVIESVEKQPQSDAMEAEEEAPPLPLREGPGEGPPLEGQEESSLTPNPLSRDEPLGRGGSTLWLRSTKFGDDMDRVLRRRDGRLTYIASDVAYHKDKFNRPPNADKLITILGPDHHGYIHRLQAVLAALLERPNAGGSSSGELDEIEKDIYRTPTERDDCKAALDEARRKLEVVIFQIVRFVKDGKPAPMRKRDGNIYELRDLITELGQAVAANATNEEQQRIGADVARFFYLMRSHDTHMDFDIDLATKQSDDNPVFYVQYAHARICSVLRKAEENGLKAPTPEGLNTALLIHVREQALIRKILDLPMEVLRCAEDYGVHRLTTYSIELGRMFHHFYDACRVIQTDQPDLSQARLALCEAARLALQSTLDLLGVSAPRQMERAARGDGDEVLVILELSEERAK